jgi:transposase
MAPATRSRPRRSRQRAFVQKPHGQVTARVQAVGPEHFGILSIDVAKARSKMMLCDFYGRVLLPPTEFAHTSGDLHAAVDQFRQACRQHDLRDHVVAIERTGEYHRPVQRTFRDAGSEVRLVHPFATKQFRQPADPGNKTDETDLAAIHRATVNGFGLLEAELPAQDQQLQMTIRHRRDLVAKTCRLCCQIREHLHAAMPGYENCFEDLWLSKIALVIARQTGSAAAVRQAGVPGLALIVTQAGLRCHQATLAKILAWTDTAPPAHPQAACLRGILADLDDDRLAKTRQIQALERTIAAFVVHTPYVLLLALPGINVVSAGDLAGEMGPIAHYGNANAITGRAGLIPSRYQSDRVDHADGPLLRRANRRLRRALMQIADNLVACNHYFRARAALWEQAGKDPRWIRVKVAKSFSRLAYAVVAGRQLVPHACLQKRHYILDKISAFHRDHDTAVSQLLQDLQAAVEQLPPSEYQAEAKPLDEQLEKIKANQRGPQLLSEILPIVLARLGRTKVQSTVAGDQDPGERPRAKEPTTP